MFYATAERDRTTLPHDAFKAVVAPRPWRRIGALLPTFSPQECVIHFKNSGYAALTNVQRQPPHTPLMKGSGSGWVSEETVEAVSDVSIPGFRARRSAPSRL